MYAFDDYILVAKYSLGGIQNEVHPKSFLCLIVMDIGQQDN